MKTHDINHNEFRHSIVINAPIDTVFNMWLDPLLLKNWFVKDIQFTDKDKADYTCTWGGGTIEKGEIFYSKHERKISFNLKYIKCEVIMRRNKQTTIVISRLTNLYYDFDLFKLLNYSNYWTFYLTNLKTFAEYGIDLREHESREIDLKDQGLKEQEMKSKNYTASLKYKYLAK